MFAFDVVLRLYNEDDSQDPAGGWTGSQVACLANYSSQEAGA
jgi:hypothetical protein